MRRGAAVRKLPRMKIDDLLPWLHDLAPLGLAEGWDNVGLLAGSPAAPVQRVMTCLTVTPATVAEAIAQRADLMVSHHPLPFRPLSRLVDGPVAGGLLWRLASAGVAVYSPHTAFDSAARGVNQRLAEALALESTAPLTPHSTDASVGAGRRGAAAPDTTAEQLAGRVQSVLGATAVRLVGDRTAPTPRVAVACGSGGSLLAAAIEAGCHALVTGEANFHTCLEAQGLGVAVVLAGHYASERFALEQLAAELDGAFSGLEVWASRAERDPLQPLDDRPRAAT